jgi:hypothetical protein
MPTYEELVPLLLDRVPELRSNHAKEREWMREDLGPHVAFGDLLNPYLISLLESGSSDETLSRIFAFLEELAGDERKLVQEVVALTVCERLTDSEIWLTAAWPYMGPRTRQFCKEVAKYWGTSRGFPFE